MLKITDWDLEALRCVFNIRIHLLNHFLNTVGSFVDTYLLPIFGSMQLINHAISVELSASHVLEMGVNTN